MGSDSHGVNEILDRLHDTAEGEQKVSIGDIVDALGERGYGPLLFVPALIDISPIEASRHCRRSLRSLWP